MTDVTGDQLALPAPAARPARWRAARAAASRRARAAGAAAWTAARDWRVRRTLPGAYAALALSLSIAGIVARTVGHGLFLWVFLGASGLFALRLDNRIS